MHRKPRKRDTHIAEHTATVATPPEETRKKENQLSDARTQQDSLSTIQINSTVFSKNSYLARSLFLAQMELTEVKSAVVRFDALV